MGRFIATRASARRNYTRLYAGAVRYWRMLDPQVGFYGFRIMELGLTEENEVDLQPLMAGNATSNAPTSSGSANSIVDGNHDTSALWNTFPYSPEYIWEVDLGEGNEKFITKLRWQGYTDSSYGFTGCTIERSEDGVNWVAAGTVSGMISWPGIRVWTPYYPIE